MNRQEVLLTDLEIIMSDFGAKPEFIEQYRKFASACGQLVIEVGYNEQIKECLLAAQQFAKGQCSSDQLRRLHEVAGALVDAGVKANVHEEFVFETRKSNHPDYLPFDQFMHRCLCIRIDWLMARVAWSITKVPKVVDPRDPDNIDSSEPFAAYMSALGTANAVAQVLAHRALFQVDPVVISDGVRSPQFNTYLDFAYHQIKLLFCDIFNI